MADSKQKVKKPSKNVLDYDPLAWLSDGEDDSKKIQDSSNIEKSEIKKTTAKKAVSKKTETEEMIEPDEESPGYGFFEDVSGSVEDEDSKPVVESNTASEDGYGFFNETEEKIVAESENDNAYGFFDSSEQLSSQSVKLDNSTNVINLGAELTIRSVSTCKALIDEVISNGFDVKLAAGDLQKIDTAGLQLIYSLNNTLEKISQSIGWVSSNSIINDAAQLIGMPKLLDSSEDDESYGFFNENEKPEPQGNQQEDSAFGFF